MATQRSRVKGAAASVLAAGIWAAVLVGGSAGPAWAADWPHVRGPSRNDVTTEDSGYQRGGWPPQGPVWTRNVGEGGSTPLVVGADRLYAIGWQDDKDTLWCLNPATGAEIWKASYPSPPYGRFADGDKDWYRGTSSTPEYDPATGLLYTLSLDGDLRCWDGATGAARWRVNLYEAFGVPRRPGPRDYGYTSSPLVHGEWLLVEVGDDEGNVVAFDKRSGRRLWSSQNRDPAGHNFGPVPMTTGGVACVAVLTLKNLVVMRLDAGHEGRTVAEYPWTTDYSNNIATPAVWGQHVVLTSGFNRNRVTVLEVTLQGARVVGELKGHCSMVGSPVVFGGHVYLPYEKLKCLELTPSGPRLRWEGGDFGIDGACLATADGRLAVFGSTGAGEDNRAGRFTLALVESAARSPDAYKELASRSVQLKPGPGRHFAWGRLVLAGGRLYCRDRMGNLVCFSISGASGGRQQ